MRVTSTSPGGNFAFSFSAAGIVPVSSSASIFSAIVLPTPGSSLDPARRARAPRPTRADSRIALAALR